MKTKDVNQKILDEFLELTKKSNFSRVFKKFRFKLKHKLWDTNDGRHDRYIIIYEAKTCRLGFFYELGGGVSVQISAIPNHSLSWESSSWVVVDHLVSYILKTPVIIWRDLGSYSRKENIKAELAMISMRFEPLAERIIDMFKDDKAVSQWKPKLKEYVKEDIRSRYGLNRYVEDP